MILPILILEWSQRVDRSFAPAPRKVDQAVWLRIGQGPQHGGVDQAENCSVRADAECQRQHGHRREAGILGQHVQPVTKLLYQSSHKLTWD